MIDFCFDKILSAEAKFVWPNLFPFDETAVHVGTYGRVEVTADWGTTAPWTQNPMLLRYMEEFNVPFNIWLTPEAPAGSIYLVDVTFFSLDIDYFSYLSNTALARIRNREIKMVLVYGEADCMTGMKEHILRMCETHGIDDNDVFMVVGRSLSDTAPANFFHLDEDFYLYQCRQQESFQQPLDWHGNYRNKIMTVLSRIHKDWRGHFCSWFWDNDYHKASYFSYSIVSNDANMSSTDDVTFTSILLDTDPDQKEIYNNFLSKCPFEADNLSVTKRNLYSVRIDEFFTDSYWNLVLETHMSLESDAAGVFITEKTWKPIAQAQPFIILGTPGTLKYLKNMGYRTFSEIGLDERYDDILDPNERMSAVRLLVKNIFKLSPEQHLSFINSARPILEHNQRLFWSSGREKLIDFVNQIKIGCRKTTPF